MTDLKPCPFCGENVWTIYAGCGEDHSVVCENCEAASPIAKSAEDAVKEWNTRPAEDALKAENDELRYIVKQFEQWRGDDDTRCPKYQHPDYPCPGEKEFKEKFGEDADFDSIECIEWGEGCWVEYYRWKFRQKNNAPDTEKGEKEQ